MMAIQSDFNGVSIKYKINPQQQKKTHKTITITTTTIAAAAAAIENKLNERYQ